MGLTFFGSIVGKGACQDAPRAAIDYKARGSEGNVLQPSKIAPRGPNISRQEIYFAQIGRKSNNSGLNDLPYAPLPHLLTFSVVRQSDAGRRRQWIERYHREYSLPKAPLRDDLFVGDAVFLEAQAGDVAAGFIRLLNKTHFFENVLTGPVWAIEDAYVDASVRRSGAYKALIEAAVSDYSARLLHVHSSYYARYREFYDRVGFRTCLTGATETDTGSTMHWLMHDVTFHEFVVRCPP